MYAQAVLVSVALVLQVTLAQYYGSYEGYGGYQGPLASPVVTADGFLADTPEVAAAKQAHMNLLAKQSHGSFGSSFGSSFMDSFEDSGFHDDDDDAHMYDDGSYKPHLYER